MTAESVEVITTFITTVGFPIAAFCVLLWMYNKQSNDRATDQKEWQATVQNNTKALELLKEVLEHNGNQ